jgi:hypothetical protein
MGQDRCAPFLCCNFGAVPPEWQAEWKLHTNVYGTALLLSTMLLFRKRISTAPLLLFTERGQINKSCFAGDAGSEILPGSIWDMRHVVRSTRNTHMAEHNMAIRFRLIAHNQLNRRLIMPCLPMWDDSPARSPGVVSSWPDSETCSFGKFVTKSLPHILKVPGLCLGWGTDRHDWGHSWISTRMPKLSLEIDQ